MALESPCSDTSDARDLIEAGAGSLCRTDQKDSKYRVRKPLKSAVSQPRVRRQVDTQEKDLRHPPKNAPNCRRLL
jgi:hypothetical protein